jgi:putative holliday junction resolvase
MRWMGIDLGERRIGLALSDQQGWLATPLQILLHRSIEEDVQAICGLVTTHQVEALVVGLPLNMDNTAGLAARRARRFAQRLRQRLGKDVVLWDERLSSVDARQALSHLSITRRRQRIDAVAAALILQNYLDTAGGGQSREPGQ